MERIASFTVDHTVLVPGLYLSRRDGNVVTFDLRFKGPTPASCFQTARCTPWSISLPLSCAIPRAGTR